jgi:hypothetical protein
MSPHTLVAIPAEFMGSYSNRAMEHLVTAADDGTLCPEIGGDVIAQLAFSGDLHFLIHDSFTGRWRHRRFLRDPVTRHVELLQIGGRLTARQLSAVLEARSPAGILSRVAMPFCSACSRGYCAGGLRRVESRSSWRATAGGISDGVDASHAVGCFTIIFPVALVVCDEIEPIWDLVRSMRKQPCAVLGNDFGFRAPRYLGSPMIRQHLAMTEEGSEISFNYLGQPEASLRDFGVAPTRLYMAQSGITRIPPARVNTYWRSRVWCARDSYGFHGSTGPISTSRRAPNPSPAILSRRSRVSRVTVGVRSEHSA